MSEVVIVDSGGANLASLTYAFERLDCHTVVTSDGSTIASAERVVLPGVGAARHAMQRLKQAGLISVLMNLTQPVLGVCLGMQLLFDRTEEDKAEGLSLIPGDIRKLTPSLRHPVPHMGWNELKPLRPDPILDGLGPGQHVYFVHSYAAPVMENTLATTTYGTTLSAIVRRRNFWGTQFHPERSGAAGTKILDNFLRLEL